MSEITTLADVERLCWHLSGWSVEQRDVDRLLASIQAYAGAQGSGAPAPWPATREGTADGPESPVEGFAPPPALLEAYEAPGEAHTPLQATTAPVQHIHVTGTLTLLCPGTHQPLSGGKKTCAKCGNRKPVEEFSRDAKGEGGRRYACKDCENKRKRESRRAKQQRCA